jgi:signal transduction histidine kinase
VTAVALLGWLAAALSAVVALRLRRRLELVARAEHELRGPLTAFGLALHAARRTAGGRRLAPLLDAELARARVALEDLTAARVSGRRAAAAPRRMGLERLVRSSAGAWTPATGRAVEVTWDAGPVTVRADRSRVAQALGNLIANAVEHGAGPIAVRARRSGQAVRVEVANRVKPTNRGPTPTRGDDRGRGLAIAAAAARDAGGTLSADIGPAGAVAAIELPVEP